MFDLFILILSNYNLFTMSKVIITGSTGMVGKGVLFECLDSTTIKEVLVINRSSLDMNHPKLKEVLIKDFTQLATIKEVLNGYDACFHCMGVSAAGMNEEKYTALTFYITKVLADLLYELNPNMTFNYVSGMGTDSSENGRSMWARVKGATENYILNVGFEKAYMFRPGIILPEKGIRSKTKLYNFGYTIAKPFFGLMKKSSSVTTTTKVGLAMIKSLTKDIGKLHLENKDINLLAE